MQAGSRGPGQMLAGNSSEPAVDIMNDPAHDKRTNASDRAGDDPDTCRICRGEGTSDEPLFFPCKCSGSIKYVHQDCLMEWLSHSQKKYCELCKTPFRFTKLYHPEMPNRIPTAIFVRRAAIHFLNFLLTWCRGILVLTVWLFVLPWCMRVVWRALFWFGDAGWMQSTFPEPQSSRQLQPPLANTSVSDILSAVVSAALQSANGTKPANSSVEGVPLLPPTVWAPFSQTLNMSAGEPSPLTLIKRFLLGIQPATQSYSASTATNSTVDAPINSTVATASSLLSDVGFFTSLTPSPVLNRFIIDVFEGQIITLLVVVAFILIFLIREWVVQQQPIMNLAGMGVENQEPEADADVDMGQAELDDDAELDGEEHEEDSEIDEHPRFITGGEMGESDQSSSDWDFEDDREHLREGDEATGSGHHEEHTSPSPSTSRTGFVSDNIRNHALELTEYLPAILRDALRRRNLEEVDRLLGEMPEMEAEIANEMLALVWQHSKLFGESSYVHSSGGSALDASAASEGNVAETQAHSAVDRHVRRRLEDLRNRLMLLRRDDDQEAEQSSDHSNSSWQRVPPNGPSIAEGDWATNDAFRSDETRDHVSDNIHGSADRDVAMPPEQGRRLSESPDNTHDHVHPREWDDHPNTIERDQGMQNPEPLLEGHEEYDHGTAASSQGPSAQGLSSEIQNEGNTDSNASNEAPPASLWDRTFNWFWGDIDITDRGNAPEAEPQDEHIIQDFADEAPFVPVVEGQPANAEDNAAAQDPEVAAAAAQAGIDLNDQEAIDDAEDLEGILELIGMQGPLIGLVQNACFSAVLISATLALAVWVPYLWGKMVLLLVGSPVSLLIRLPLQLLSSFADFLVDSSLFLGGLCVFWITTWASFGFRVLMMMFTLSWTSSYETAHRPIVLIAAPAKSMAESALGRLMKLYLSVTASPASDWAGFSMNSHAALRTVQAQISRTLNSTGDFIALWSSDSSSNVAFSAAETISSVIASTIARIRDALIILWNSKGYKITLSLGSAPPPVEPSLDQWSSQDRAIAILIGYLFFTVAGTLYLRRGAPFSTTEQARRVENVVIDILQQAGGVLKVILIISIEMLTFPLYCGILLDVATLPLFEGTTLSTRYHFTVSSPWISGFVHWFVGTCYMFHFALFVSMCRKIMRTGVLYFIRDPDDPTFHPVRDVLERPVSTQLRKIAFSALVYGTLVIVCLGGVIWSLNYSFPGIFPIHWASHIPSVEFPLDLLFYNFLTPFIIRVTKPSDGLHTMYQWWFRKCARVLRLSDFLFGDKNEDEQLYDERPLWQRVFKRRADEAKEPHGEDAQEERGADSSAGNLKFHGKFVRAPASDQVRIPKGHPVFVEVDRNNRRLDGKPDEGVHARSSGMVTKVYIPTWFRLRVALFVLSIWFFAATTGLGATILPLLFGRWALSCIVPDMRDINDIYAFSLGVYVLGAILYACVKHRVISQALNGSLRSTCLTTIIKFAATVKRYTVLVSSCIYVYTALLVVLPVLFAFVLECYILLPLHSFIDPDQEHVVHIVQDWTVGILYARVLARIVIWGRTPILTRALRAVVRDGYGRPSVRIATRGFIIPALVAFIVLMGAPAATAQAVLHVWSGGNAVDPLVRRLVFRFAYPALLGVAALGWGCNEMLRATKRWRRIIRDEVYLVGERLHNFGERKASGRVVEVGEGSARRV